MAAARARGVDSGRSVLVYRALPANIVGHVRVAVLPAPQYGSSHEPSTSASTRNPSPSLKSLATTLARSTSVSSPNRLSCLIMSPWHARDPFQVQPALFHARARAPEVVVCRLEIIEPDRLVLCEWEPDASRARMLLHHTTHRSVRRYSCWPGFPQTSGA